MPVKKEKDEKLTESGKIEYGGCNQEFGMGQQTEVSSDVWVFEREHKKMREGVADDCVCKYQIEDFKLSII